MKKVMSIVLAALLILNSAVITLAAENETGEALPGIAEILQESETEDAAEAVPESELFSETDAEDVTAKAAILLPAPEEFRVYQYSLTSVRITWQPEEKFDHYELFRSVHDSGSWSKVKNIYDGYGSNLNLEPGTRYSYKIRGVSEKNGVKEYGAFSQTESVEICDFAVSDLTVRQKNLSSVSISWNEQSGITKYELYRSEDLESWSRVKTVYSSSTSNLNLTTGRSYYYRVRAYVETPEGTFAGSFCDPVPITMLGIAPLNLSVEKSAASSVRLTWARVEGCDHYELFREVNSSGVWNKVKSIYGEVGSNLNLVNGNRYSYRVRAVFTNSEFTYAGEFSDSAAIDFGMTEALVEPPVLRSVRQIGSNRVQVEWDEVANADYYVLYRSDNGGKWVRVKTSTEPFAQNLALREGIRYQYRVTAVYQDSDGEHESNPSGELSFALGQDFSQITDLSAGFLSNNRVLLDWTDSSEDADGYALYRKTVGGTWSKAKTVSGCQTYNSGLSEGEIYYYYVRAYRNSELGAYYSTPSNTVVYWNQGISGAAISDGVLSWKKIENADGYIILSEGEEIAAVENGTEFPLTDEWIGCTLQICAYRELEDVRAASRMSEGIVYSQGGHAEYRALLIGETAYTARLNGPDNDMGFMESMLNGLNNPYDVIAQQDATFDELVELIDIAFDGADADDVSLFYYSGHGVTGAGAYYSGALQTVDYQYLTTGDLAELLSAIPGRVIVILDSCGSGAVISDGTESTQPVHSVQSLLLNNTGDGAEAEPMSFDAEQFNRGVMEAFRAVDSVIEESDGSSDPDIIPKAGELRQTKFFVLTGSAYEESSYSTMTDGVWGGIFTRGIACGTGCSYPEGIYSGTMPADTNGDNGICFLELAAFCQNYVGDRQKVLSYSASPRYIIFER